MTETLTKHIILNFNVSILHSYDEYFSLNAFINYNLYEYNTCRIPILNVCIKLAFIKKQFSLRFSSLKSVICMNVKQPRGLTK